MSIGHRSRCSSKRCTCSKSIRRVASACSCGTTSDGEDVRTVRDGDVAVIASGYHPVVAAPGYSLYYLWVMAGNGRAMAPFLEPQHAWLQQGR